MKGSPIVKDDVQDLEIGAEEVSLLSIGQEKNPPDTIINLAQDLGLHNLNIGIVDLDLPPVVGESIVDS
jgi:hypothetical protein